jgi:hypothetical protein
VNTVGPEPVPEPVPEPTSAPPPFPRPARRHPRRTARRAAAAVLVAALAGVGIGEMILQTDDRDDSATAASVTAPAVPGSGSSTLRPSPSASPSWGAHSNGNHFGSLRSLLLPVPESMYLPGPDDGLLGNDAELDRAKLAASLDRTLKGLPKERRQVVRDAWNAMRLRAGALRTYRVRDGDFMVEMSLDQLNQQAVKAVDAYSRAIIDVSGDFREGPAVAGHTKARCVLPPVEPSAEIEYMSCFAAVGDLMVSMQVTGVGPLNKDLPVKMFGEQLDRLAIPGASV